MVQWPWPPGTIVVCINDKLDLYILNRVDAPLMLNRYYTIRKTGVSVSDGVTKAVMLNEIYGVREGDWEQSFLADRFRPAESDHVETTVKETAHA